MDHNKLLIIKSNKEKEFMIFEITKVIELLPFSRLDDILI